MEKAQYEHIEHPFPPVWDARSEILILGSLPSVKSRAEGFYYGHPRNRFWQVLAAVLREPLPETVPEKKAMLLRHGIALWDVIQGCDIRGSGDSSIRNAVPADLGPIFAGAKIRCVICNGKTAGALYTKYQEPRTGIPAIVLPSTSPANAAFGLEKLISAWAEALDVSDKTVG